VKRLLQLGTLLLLLATFVTPISEYFDRWDAAGLSNDTEFAIFVLALSLCLILLVSRSVSVAALLVQLLLLPHDLQRDSGASSMGTRLLDLVVPTSSPPPLRI
jgi:hypothetical protein